MAEMILESAVVTPRKRNYDGEFVTQPSPSTSINVVSTNETTPASQHVSPARSSCSSLTEMSFIVDPANNTKVSVEAGKPVKKRKMTFIEREAEKAAKKREAEEKQRVKAEEKMRKEEEKRKLAEEREEVKRQKEHEKAEHQKIKDAEKAEKQKVKDAENLKREAKKQEKEAEKARKKAEEDKKEKAQMRLKAFFINKPAPASTPPSTPDDASERTSSRRSSIASLNIDQSSPDAKSPQKTLNAEFDKWILPFFVPEYTEVAPINKYRRSQEMNFDISKGSTTKLSSLNMLFRSRPKRSQHSLPIKQIMAEMQTEDNLVRKQKFEATDLLNRVPYKYLSFKEDVRPPYKGTYTRAVSPRSSRRVSRNPFLREIPEINYDYDSEAEWEPPGDDDEDLNDEDEMSEADENEEEMADFLDDADDEGRRKGPMCDMEPISSGLCWTDQNNGDKGSELKQYCMDVLHDSTTFPIDPFSTKHWADELKPKPSPMKNKTEVSITAMQPPRLPLASLTPNTIPAFTKQESSEKETILSKPKGRSPNPDKAVKLIDTEFLPSFKQAIEGSDLTKAGLIEILKKQFPKCSKDAIKDTLGMVAVRVGKKEAEKKWQLIA